MGAGLGWTSQRLRLMRKKSVVVRVRGQNVAKGAAMVKSVAGKVLVGLVAAGSMIGAGWLAAEVTRPLAPPAPLAELGPEALPGQQAVAVPPLPRRTGKAYFEELMYAARFQALMLDEGDEMLHFRFPKTNEPFQIGECPSRGKPCIIVSGGGIDAYDDTAGAAIVGTSFTYGGTGVLVVIYYLKVENGAVVVSEPFTLGDRVPVNSVSLQGERVVVKLLTHRDTDGLCCPTKKTTLKLRFDGRRLVRE